MKDVMVDVSHVSMRFTKANMKIDSIKEYFVRMVKRELFFETFLALDDVTFQVGRGEIFGIVGLNGSGKSTLLKIISGIMKPTAGTAETLGSISPMIELGAGFDPDLTGRENIFLNGTLLGHSKEYMASMYDEIVAFAELEEFIDMQAKNYSSGMLARLGFSIATLVKPQILICDEVLAVGDYRFKEKSEKRIQELMAGDTTVLLVSHSIEQIRNLCSRVLWLEKGKVMMIGETDAVCDAYMGVDSSAQKEE